MSTQPSNSPSSPPSKSCIIEELVAHLDKERLVYERIATQSRLDAIDGEMKQEGKYDTRAIEASYLAGAQQRRLEEIVVEIQGLKALESDNFATTRSVSVGSLVQVENSAAQFLWYFLSPNSGGIEVQVVPEVKVVSLHSPIGQALLGLQMGEEPFRTPLPAPLRASVIVMIL